MKDLTLVIEGVPITLPESEWSTIVRLSKWGGIAKLSISQAWRLRCDYHAKRATATELAARHDLSKRQVFRILSGENYRNVPHPASARGYAALRDPDLCQFIDDTL